MKLKPTSQERIPLKRPSYLVIFFLQDKDDIARLHAGRLVSFATKGYFLPVLHSLVHMHLQNLHFLHNFLALTFFAAVFLANNFTWRGNKQRVSAPPPPLRFHGVARSFASTAAYLLRYNRYTQTASVGPFRVPAA